MKILVPIDGSQNALQAVTYAVKQAKAFPDVHLTILYVALQESNAMRTQNFEETSSDAAEKVFAAAKALLEQVPAIFHMVSGISAADQILDYAEAGQFDAIIMGCRGMSDLKRFFLGSVSTRVSQNAPCTVTLVK